MKNKNLVLTLFLTSLMLAAFPGCAKSGTNAPITLTIKTDKFNYETANFEVKQSSLTHLTNSKAELKLSNYAAAELMGDRKDDQIDIVVTLTVKGDKIIPGTYNYGDYAATQFSFVQINTNKGLFYFNWVSGMPRQGSVIINDISANSANGDFALAVEKAENKNIGIVRLNGSFNIKK